MESNQNYSSINTTTVTNESRILFDIDNNNTQTYHSQSTDLFEPIIINDANPSNIEFTIEKSSNYSYTMTGIIKSIDQYEYNTEMYNDYPYFISKPLPKFIPKLSRPSEILTERQLKELHAHLPYYQQFKDMTILYSLKKDGSSIKTLYSKAEGINTTIMITMDDDRNIFGAYISEELHYQQGHFYGTGETFLFSFFKSEKIHCFLSTGENDNFIYSDYDRIAFGCSNESFSLSLDNDFLKGYSKTTNTFKNPPLSQKDTFGIIKVELLGFKQ